MALRNIAQSLKTLSGKLDATKLATIERDIQGFLPTASKKEFLEVSDQVVEAKAYSEPLWSLIQTQYLQRFDEFTAEDTLAFYNVVSRCPLDIYREVDERLWTSLVYLGKQESDQLSKKDPAFESKMDTVIQGVLSQVFGTVIPMIKEPNDIFNDVNRNVEFVTRDRRPDDIENKIQEILGIEDLEVENYNPALEKLYSGQVEDEDEQMALWASLFDDKNEPAIVNVKRDSSQTERVEEAQTQKAEKVGGTQTKKVGESNPAKKA